MPDAPDTSRATVARVLDRARSFCLYSTAASNSKTISKEGQAVAMELAALADAFDARPSVTPLLIAVACDAYNANRRARGEPGRVFADSTAMEVALHAALSAYIVASVEPTEVPPSVTEARREGFMAAAPPPREYITKVELSAGTLLCEARHHEGHHLGPCPTCRADLVRLVDAPASVPPSVTEAMVPSAWRWQQLLDAFDEMMTRWPMEDGLHGDCHLMLTRDVLRLRELCRDALRAAPAQEGNRG